MPIGHLPTLRKAWQQRVVPVPAESTAANQAAATFVALKNTWRQFNQPWLVVGSSDSVTAALDGVDRILTKANVVNNAAGVHSWWVGKNAAGVYICVDFNTSGKHLATVVMSPSAGFTGGTTSARPTATDEVVAISQADWLAGAAAVGDFSMVVIHAVDGRNTHSFVACNGVLLSEWIIGEVSDVVAGWTLPHVAMVGGSQGIADTRLHLTTRQTDNSRFVSRGPSGSMPNRLMLPASYGNFLTIRMTAASPVSGRWLVVPCGVLSLQAGMTGRHGMLTDVWRGSDAGSTGRLFRDAAGPFFIQLGGWVVPWDGSAWAP